MVRTFYVVWLGVLALFTLLCFNCNPPLEPPLTITVTAESTVIVRDTLLLHFEADEDPDNITWYIRYDNSWRIDSTQETVFPVVWDFPDTGLHQLVVYTYGRDGRASNNDTIHVTVTSKLPRLSIYGDSVAYVNDTSFIKVDAQDSDGSVKQLVWSKNGELPRIMPIDTVIPVVWTVADSGVQKIVAYVIDNDGHHSAADSIEITVYAGNPVIMLLSGDTLVSINDTARFSCQATDKNGIVTQYQWIMANDTLDRIISGGKLFKWVWHLPDTGEHSVRVRVVDDDGLFSGFQAITVRVTAFPPTAILLCGSEHIAGTPSILSVQGSDSDGKVASYNWTFETAGGLFKKVSTDTFTSFTWSNEDIGTNIVSVVAVDDDTLMSTVAVCTLTVHGSAPELLPYNDTTLSSNDTLLFSRTLKDSKYVVDRWLFTTDGGEWDDSGTTPSHTVFYTGRSRVAVITSARCTSYAASTDTFYVTFNRPPEIIQPRLHDGDTLWTKEGTIPGTLTLPLAASDPDGDSITTLFVWGRGEKRDTCLRQDSIELSIDTTGLYEWEYRVTDSFGNVTYYRGVTPIGIEHTVCFAGHSIAVGLGDSTLSGGFRPAVLASLRDSIGSYERIRAIGPFVTSQENMNDTDDSCYAISGAFAREMLLLMEHSYTALTADIWVLMLGVNGSFSSIETTATKDLMNEIVKRNPNARLYVLTSQPMIAVSNVQRNYYNNHIRAEVATLKANGYAAFVVETGDSTLYLNGKFNDTLAFDLVHPNTLGYQRAGEAIKSVMWEREPRVLDVRKE